MSQIFFYRIETAEVFRRLGILFAAHSDITSAFNHLLPSKLNLENGCQHLLAFQKTESDKITEISTEKDSSALSPVFSNLSAT